MSRTVIVIGAGASGMMAAIASARSKARVTILEAQDHAGKKLLVTGSGRCNLTNLSENLPGKYHGTGSELAKILTEQYGAKETLSFFEDLGLLTIQKDGWVYPYTLQSTSVLDVLMREMRRLKVNMKFNQKILMVKDKGNSSGYEIKTPEWTYQCDAVILACGSMAAPSTGAGNEGILLAQTLGHTIRDIRPALVPLSCDFPYLNRLSGVRCRADLTLSCDGKVIARDSGELQWTRYGLSGIVIFQLSRYVNEQGPYVITIDFLPDYEEKKLRELLFRLKSRLRDEPVTVLLRGIVHEKMIRMILEVAKIDRKSCLDLTDKDIENLCHTLKNFSVPVRGLRSFDQAQVCSGGVDCREVNENLESVFHPGLYFSGEMLDVDGPCGGYNLQWAWTSGQISGSAAAKDCVKYEGDDHGD